MIEIQHLTKCYGSHTAVSDLNFTIESGKIYGLLGPNGAGKSTTMNIITGCLAATDGHVIIDGHDIFEAPETGKGRIGYLPEQPPLYLDMTPYEYLKFVAKAKGVKKDKLDEALKHVIEVTQIEDVAGRLIKHLSKGYKQRVGIAQAILGDPGVIILDEPTVGLDPLQIIEIRDLIRQLGKKHTVILSSHILSEVRAACDHIIIISKGRLVASDTPDNLEKLFAGVTTLDLVVRASKAEVSKALSKHGIIGEITYTPNKDGTADVKIETESPDDIAEAVFFAFSDIRRPILRMASTKASLEDVFLELTAGKDEIEPAAENGEEEADDQ